MISILFVKSEDPESWAIRAVTDSNVSHCGVCTSWGVYEMTAKGLVCTPETKFQQRCEVVTEWKWPGTDSVDSVLAYKIALYCRNAVAQKFSYDWLGLLGELWVQLNRKLGRAVVDPWHMRHAMICSAFCLRTLKANGYITPRLIDLDPVAVTPGQLRDTLFMSRSNNGL